MGGPRARWRKAPRCLLLVWHCRDWQRHVQGRAGSPAVGCGGAIVAGSLQRRRLAQAAVRAVLAAQERRTGRQGHGWHAPRPGRARARLAAPEAVAAAADVAVRWGRLRAWGHVRACVETGHAAEHFGDFGGAVCRHGRRRAGGSRTAGHVFQRASRISSAAGNGKNEVWGDVSVQASFHGPLAAKTGNYGQAEPLSVKEN